MDKVWVLLTWWTPTCEDTEFWRAPGDSNVFRDELISMVEQDISVDVINVISTDSSDLRASDHEILAQEIKNQSWKGYRGFVIIHGSDTNAYTLATHSYMVKWLSIPIIHTGSNIPLHDAHSDFPANFVWSIDAIFWDELLWTYQFFWHMLNPGVKITKQNTNSLYPFMTPHNHASFGIQGSDWKFHIDPVFREAINKAHRKTSTILDIDTHLEKDIELIKLTPFMDYNIFDFYRESGKKWILIEGFGDGNTPTSDEFQQTIQRCIDSGMIILLWSQCVRGERFANYEWWQKLIDMGAILMRHHTSEAALWKLSWALWKYGSDLDEVKAAILRDVNWDLILK